MVALVFVCGIVVVVVVDVIFFALFFFFNAFIVMIEAVAE